MSALEIAWSVVGILAPVVVGVGFAVLSLPTAEFRAARACLVLSALMLAGMAVFWSFESDASTVRLWTVDGAIGIGICTLLPAGLLWISNRQHMFKEPTQSPVSLDPASVRELAGAIGDAVHPPGIDRRPTLPGLGQSEEARYWSERASWDRLQQDGKATKQLVVVGDDAPDILLELSATRASNADLYKAIPISVYSAVDVVAMNVQIDPVESGVWHGGNYGGDTDTAAGPILCNTRLVFELVAHIPGNTKVSVFPVIDYQNLTESMLRETGSVLGLWWLLERVSEHKQYGALAALPADASQFDRETVADAAGREPFELALRVTFWNRQLTRQWERVESLHYDPRTRRAHIKGHGALVEITIVRKSVTLDAPDVTLEGPSEGKFILHATGHACEIRTGPIILESAPFGFLEDIGKRPVRTPHYALEFSVRDLRDGDKEITPTLFCGEGYSRSSWPEEESERGGVEEFLRMAVMIRSGPASERREVDWDRPLHISFDITFWNSEHTYQWMRRELLVYEPLTGRAFVRHSGKPEPVLGPSIGANP